MQKKHGLIASLWILFMIMLQLGSAFFYLFQPHAAAIRFPELSAFMLVVYGFHSLAGALLMMCLFDMKKWAFYLYVLLCFLGAYMDVETLHATWNAAASARAPAPFILLVVLYYTGSWIAMDSVD